MNRSTLAFCLCLLFAAHFRLVGALQGQDREAIQEVVLHPIVNDTFVCAEHAEGELTQLGDALGKDCMVIRMDSTRAPDKRLPSLFEGDGLENGDWFSWEVPLLAPCDGTVESTQANARTNRPGEVPSDEALEPASEKICMPGRDPRGVRARQEYAGSTRGVHHSRRGCSRNRQQRCFEGSARSHRSLERGHPFSNPV